MRSMSGDECAHYVKRAELLSACLKSKRVRLGARVARSLSDELAALVREMGGDDDRKRVAELQSAVRQRDAVISEMERQATAFKAQEAALLKRVQELSGDIP